MKVYYPGIGESRLSMVRRKKEDKNPFGDVDGSRNLELEALKIKRREVNPRKILIVGCVVATALSFLISAQATQSAQDAASSALSAQTVVRAGRVRVWRCGR